MKFLADVNIPFPLISFLRKNGYEVEDVTKNFPQAKDVDLIKTAQTNNQIILTRDKDFLELTNYPKYRVPLIVISLADQKTDNIIKHLDLLLKNQPEGGLKNSITVIREERADLLPLEA